MIEPSAPEEFEKAAQGHLTDEQIIQSEQRETALDPVLAVQLIIKENAHLFKDGSFNPGYLLENLKNLASFKQRITEAEERVKKQRSGETLLPVKVAKEIAKSGQKVDLNMENPEKYQKMPDTNLALLKALGAVPKEVTDLKKYINSLPIETPNDNLYYQEHGEPQGPVRIDSSRHGFEIRHLPTKIYGVFVDGHRLYSTDPTTYGQWGFGIDFTYKAVGRMLSSQQTAKQA